MRLAQQPALQLQQEFVGKSEAAKKVLRFVREVAPTDYPVLLRGETGVGKDVVAGIIHRESPRHEASFTVVNCGTLPETLAESEIFGHEKGAFTGADAPKAGLVEAAHRGTLFLNEVGDMKPDCQVKLLGFLDTGFFRRVGSVRDCHADVRVIAATNKHLEAAMAEGKFREDLYYRLDCFSLVIPSLRERLDDVSLLVDHFVELVSREIGCKKKDVVPEAIETFMDHVWPGNVRELEQTVRRAVVASQNGVINSKGVLSAIRKPADGSLTIKRDEGLYEAKKKFERQHISRALVECDWNVSRTARRLGVPRSNLYEKLKEHGLFERRAARATGEN